ncbi:MAG: single-stranded-DNA-specific exonuclease RecJ [Bacteroidales bacterium]|nr:single-stranded-DNA-specific exonuclease RecJ [Bacteroidales bacterium]
MNKLWELNNGGGYTDTQIDYLQTRLNNFCDFTIARMLAQRVKVDVPRLQNPETEEGELQKIRSFLRPSLSNLYDPFLFRDMDKAVDRLSLAIDKGEKILIYGDYDVDGTTSVALVYSFLKKYCTQNIDYYIPDRYTEGYGVSMQGVDYAAQNGCSLIIALDCGIKDNPRVDYSNSLGIDFIVCDHHTPGAELPNAVAVLDAKRSDNTYPFNELSGCGVGFKYMQALCIRRNIPFVNLLNYIDLTAVSIGSDIVPIVDENRILAYYGLKKLNGEEFSYNDQMLLLQPLTCFCAIKKEAGLAEKHVSMYDSVFMIGPRINACGRIDKGSQAVRLLITEDENEAAEFAKKISDYNNERKDLDRDITETALETLRNEPNNDTNAATVVYGDNWHKGVVGIVASRLTETYYRPTIVFSKIGDTLTGSARSVSDFNLYDAIDNCRNFLSGFGGHKFAAGLNLKFENYQNFKSSFLEYVKNHIQTSQKTPKVLIEQFIDFSVINSKFYDRLIQFEPFGPENTEPIFATRNVVDCGSTRRVGKNLEHLRLEVMDSTGVCLVGIAFGMADYYTRIHNGEKFDICYTVQKNEFRGNVSLQLMVVDIKMKETV